MTFKEFVKANPIKFSTKNSISRSFDASKRILPARPIRIFSMYGPLTKPTVLK